MIIITTNNLGRMTDRFFRRCEPMSSTPSQIPASLETGADRLEGGDRQRNGSVPEGLGKFEMADDVWIGLALQQIAPCIRTGELPRGFLTPLVRGAGRPKAPTAVNGSKTASPAHP